MAMRKDKKRAAVNAKASKRNRYGEYISQLVERELVEKVREMAPEYRRTTQGMLNTVLAFGLAFWGDKDEEARCGICLNREGAGKV